MCTVVKIGSQQSKVHYSVSDLYPPVITEWMNDITFAVDRRKHAQKINWLNKMRFRNWSGNNSQIQLSQFPLDILMDRQHRNHSPIRCMWPIYYAEGKWRWKFDCYFFLLLRRHESFLWHSNKIICPWEFWELILILSLSIIYFHSICPIW